MERKYFYWDEYALQYTNNEFNMSPLMDAQYYSSDEASLQDYLILPAGSEITAPPELLRDASVLKAAWDEV